jgi:hypothetical protein
VTIVGQVVASLAVDIVAQSIGYLKVDIAAQSLTTLSVNIVAASTTLNVSIVASSVTLNVYIADAKLTLTPTTLIEKGTQKVLSASATGAIVIVYTCPPGVTAYLLTVGYFMWNQDSTYPRIGSVRAYLGGREVILAINRLQPNAITSETFTGGLFRMSPGDYITINADTNLYLYAFFVIIEVGS